MRQDLLQKLTQIIKNKSINSLSFVYPEQLAEWLDDSLDSTLRFASDLYRERLITYKYRFNCSCGKTCTAFHKKLSSSSYICDECEHTYTLEDVQSIGKLAYEIDKIEFLNFTNSIFDVKQELMLATTPVYPYTNNILLSPKEDKMEIFLGSSSQSIEDMERIGLILEELGHTPLLWNTAGKNIFPPNSTTFDSLISITKRVHAAIFLFNADDEIWPHNSLSSVKTVRDNVLFEYGLFCGALNKTRVCFVCKNSPKLASDLSGVTYLDGSAGDLRIKRLLQDWLNNMK